MISSSTCSQNDESEVGSSTITSPQQEPYGKHEVLMRHDQFHAKSPLSPHSSISSVKSPDSTTFLSLNSPPSSSSLQSDTLSPPPHQPPSLDVNPPSTENISHVYSSASYRQCTICGDKAAADSTFGAVSCDSCGGFFKRTIKNNRQYTCVANRDCVLNKKTRNRCKACRLQSCYKVGMRDKAAKDYVEREKRDKTKKKDDKQQPQQQVVSSSHHHQADVVEIIEMSKINEAELYVDPKINSFANIAVDPIRQLCLAADKQLASLAEWAKRMPLFTTLCLADQVKLLQWNWAELLIGGFCYRSSAVSDGILLATGLHLSRENLQKAGVGTVVNRLFGEVINKMQKLQIDVAEWGCLRAIMLFAPDTKELADPHKVETIRQRYIATLCQYVKTRYKDDPDRLGNLLLRLPPLKAIALQVLEHLFFFKLIGDVPIDTFLMEMLDVDGH